MLLKGLQKLTLLDFPDKMACTVFTGGCNFLCPFCHNASLVIGERIKETPPILEEEFFDFLKKRRGILEGVCISGGEPTLQHDLKDFIKRIKELGYLIKLDTNGYRPEVLKSLIDEGLIDYVAMDIKASKDSYGIAVGIENFDISPIEKSVEILRGESITFEFRTTLLKGLHTEEDIKKIGEWLKGTERYFLQNFKDSGDLISDKFVGYDEKQTLSLLNTLREYIPNAQIRG